MQVIFFTFYSTRIKKAFYRICFSPHPRFYEKWRKEKRLPETGGEIIEYARARAGAEARRYAKNAMRSVLLLQLIHIHIHNIFIILQSGDDDF